MKSTNNSDVGNDYRGGSSSTVGQEDSTPVFLRRLNDLNVRVGTRTRFLIELDDATGVQVNSVSFDYKNVRLFETYTVVLKKPYYRLGNRDFHDFRYCVDNGERYQFFGVEPNSE